MKTENIEKELSTIDTAEEIFNLIDGLGFTSEYDVDPDILRIKIMDIINKNTKNSPVMIEGVTNISKVTFDPSDVD